MATQVTGYIMEVARIYQPDCQDKQHTYTETYIKPNRDHTFNLSVFFAQARYRVVKIAHSCFMVVL
jgi:hypothetical protein